MRLDITVCHSVLKQYLQADYSPVTGLQEDRNLLYEITKNNITLNKDLLTCYEIEFEQNPSQLDIYQSWLAAQTAKSEEETLFLTDDLSHANINSLFTSDLYFQILVNVAYTTYDKIIFSNLLTRYKTPLELLKILPMDRARILNRHENNYYNNYHLPYNKEIQNGESCSNLSKWLGRILKDETNIEIIDPYLYQNINSFKNYILPHIKHGANLTFYSGYTRDNNLGRPLNSADFINEFNNTAYSNWNISNVFSVQKIEIHDRKILTDKYVIKIGRGLDVFGRNGTTNRCDIDVYYRSKWNGVLPTPNTTIM